MRDGGPVGWSSSPATLQHLTRVSRLQRLHGHLVLQLSSCASRFYFDLRSNNEDDELVFFSALHRDLVEFAIFKYISSAYLCPLLSIYSE